MRVTFVIDMSPRRDGLFGPTSVTAQKKKLLFMLEALIQTNLIYLRSHPNTPLLYESGVRYKSEIERHGFSKEEWFDIPHILERGEGDCEDLACWRVAELRKSGVRAKAAVKGKTIAPTVTLFHVLTQWPNGRLEDPSKKLGMRGSA